MIDFIGGWLRHNLVIFVALSVLAAKLLIVRLCRDDEGEATAFLALPEDICYVILGLILGDLLNNSGAFRRHFDYSDHASIDLAVVIVWNLLCVLAIHKLGQKCTIHYQSWRGADRARVAVKEADPKQEELPFSDGQSNLHILLIRHFLLLATGYLVQMGLALWLLRWAAGIVAAT